MKKNEKTMAYIITLIFWACCIDMTIENQGPVWLAVLISNIATIISIITCYCITSYAKE